MSEKSTERQKPESQQAYQKPAIIWEESLDVKAVSASFSKCQSDAACVAAGHPDPRC